jgi:pyruvate/2-oxoglutarate dehydrogenase complex dihydrolipoamide dehydrogenase (E3) component
MFDVVVIGEGSLAREVATAASAADMKTIVVQADQIDNTESTFEMVKGRAFVAGHDRVAVLDPLTGDEKRILTTATIVVATSAPPGMLGLAKLGVHRHTNGLILTDDHSRTSCRNVFAVTTDANGQIARLISAIRACLTTTRPAALSA